MKFKKIAHILIFVIASSFFLQADLFAQKAAYVADFICEYAKNLYDQGVLEEAKHEFSKALIIDPDNVMAKSYLKKMGLDMGNYAIERPDLAVSQFIVASPPAIVLPQPYEAAVFSPADSFNRDELVLLGAQLADLKKQIHALQVVVASKDGDIKAKEDETSLLKEKFILAQERLDQLHKDASVRDQLLAKLKGQLSALEASSARQLDMYKTKLEALESSVNQVSTTMQEGQKQSQREDAQAFSQEVASLRAQLDILQKEADGKDGDVNRMKDMLQALEMASITQIKKYQNALEKLEGSMAVKSDEAGAKQESLEMLAQELALAENQSKALEEELALKNRELEEAKTKVVSHVELSEKQSRLHTEEMDALRSSLSQARKELSVKETSLIELEKKLVLSREEAASLKDEVLKKAGQTKDFEDSFTQREKELKEKEESLKELSAQSQHLRLEVDKLAQGVEEKEKNIRKLEREFEDYKERLDQELHVYRGQIKIFESAVAEKDKIINEKQEHAAAVEQELGSLRKDLEASRLAREGVAVEKDEIIKKHVQELAYAEGELKNLREVVKAKDDALKEAAQTLESRIVSSERQVREQEEKVGNLQKSLALKDEALNEINAKLARTQQEFDELRDEIEGKEGQLLALNEETNSLKVDAVREIKGYEDEVKSLKDSLEAKELEISEKQETIGRLNTRLTSAAGELAQLRSDASKRAEQVRQLKEEIGALKDILGRHFQTYNDQISTLQSSFSQADDLKAVKEQMRSLAVVSGRQLKVYHDKLKTLNSSLAYSQKELELRNMAVGVKDAEIKALEDRLGEVYEGLGDVGGQLADKEAQIKELKDRLRAFMRSSSRQFKALNEHQEQRLYEIQRNNLQDKDVLADKLRQLQRDADEFKDKALANQARVKELENQLSEQKVLLEKEISLYAGRLDALVSSKNSQDNILGQKQKLVEELLVARGELEATVRLKEEALKSEEKNSADQVKVYKDHLDVAQKSLLLKDELIREKEAVLEDISDKLALALKDIEKQKDELSGRQKEIEDLKKYSQEQSASWKEDLTTSEERVKIAEGEIEDLKNRLEQAQETVREKQDNLDELLKANSAMEDQLSRLRMEVSDKDARLEDFEKMKKDFECRTEEYQEQMKVLEAAFAVKQEDYQKQELMIKELSDHFSRAKEQLEEKIKAKETEIGQLSETLKLTADESDCLKKELAKKETDLKELSLKKEASVKAQKKQSDQYEQQLKSLEDADEGNKKLLKEKEKSINERELLIMGLKKDVEDLQEKIGRHETDIAAKEEELGNLKNSLKESQEKVSRYEDQFETLEALLSDKNYQLQTFKGKLDGQAAMFGQQLAEYKKKVASLEALIDAKEQAVTDQGLAVEAKNTAMKDLSNDYARVKETAAQLQDTLSAREDLIRRLEDELKNAGYSSKESAQRISYLENLLVAKDKDLEDKGAVNSLREAGFADLAEKLNAAEKQIVELKHALSDKKDKESELARLKEQLTVLKKDFAASQEKDKTQQGRISILEKSLGDRNKKEQESKENNQEKETLIKDLYAKIESLEMELEKNRSKAADKESQFNKLKEEIRDLASVADQQKRSYEDKISVFETSTVAKEKLAQLNNEIKTLASSSSRQLEMYKDQLSVLEESLSLREAQIKKQESLVRSHADELMEKEKALKDLTLKFEKTQAALDELRSELSDKNSLIEGYKERIKDLAAAAGRELKGHKALLSKLSGKNDELESLVQEKDVMMKEQVDELNATMAQLRQSLKSEIKDYQAKLDLAKKGIVVGVLADVLFGSGSADMSAEGKKVLTKISNVLKKIPDNNHFVVEGHTDNVPIRYSHWSSNWELSSQRALSVLEYLIQESGLDPMRFSAQGYGEYRPVADNSTDAGKKQNRRVEIVIQPQMRKVDANELPVLSDSDN